MAFFHTNSDGCYLPLRGKTAIVTGGTRGMGAEISLELAKRGANVAIISSHENSSHVHHILHLIKSLPHAPRVYACFGDLRRIQDPRILVNKIEGWMKTELRHARVDILVNNAGVNPAEFAARKGLGDVSVDDFSYVYNLNVRGTILMTQEVLHLLPSNARIINISSVGARLGLQEMSLFCSSKAAVESLTRCWAQELGSNGTTVNAVSPGFLEGDNVNHVSNKLTSTQKAGTPLQNRIGTNEEVTKVVAWLAGEDSKWVTGQTISASGGWAMF